MTSESDTDSSSSSLERKRKLHKKLKMKSAKKFKKHKKEKKKKSHKEKKRTRKESALLIEESSEIRISEVQPRTEVINTDSNSAHTFGPALPPHLTKNTENVEISEVSKVIGPVIPKELLDPKIILDVPTDGKFEDEKKDAAASETDEQELQDSYGPLPFTNEGEMSAAQVELEQRALKLKLAAIDGTSTTVSEQNVREEWMLELPDVGLKSGLAALNNLKRGFHQGKEKPDFSDRSSWTKTPQMGNDKQSKSTSKTSQEQLEQQASALYEKQRDAEQESIARKHKKKHKREESLVEMHQKKLRKEEKKKAKELKESGVKPERRPFTRDIDLKLNKIDRNQTKQIVDKAKILNTKFSTGQSKYL
ncbi:hypothetical protein DOY81_006059 [Sarcophaga bullata]|nr:hypothetical protein DOY81_006059 [Sarcophaga bullata]